MTADIPNKGTPEWYEWLERRGEELELDFTKSIFWQIYKESKLSFLEVWTPDIFEKERPQ